MWPLGVNLHRGQRDGGQAGREPNAELWGQEELGYVSLRKLGTILDCIPRTEWGFQWTTSGGEGGEIETRPDVQPSCETAKLLTSRQV